MSVGGIFLLISFCLWFLVGVGLHPLPGVEAFAHAALVLGLLLSGIPVPWPRP
jgi:hypothetical protein